MIGNKIQTMKNKGFTLIELLVSVFVFTLIIGASSGVFISGIRLQRRALATQQLLDEVSFAAEYMSRLARMAKRDETGICITAGNNYEIRGSGFRFLNYKDECQEFFLDTDGQLKESKSGGGGIALTSKDFQVLSFNIELSGERQGDNEQPRVTFFLEVEGKGLDKPKIQLQTTTSQRNLDM